jgi:hypothetical protein
MFRSYQTVPSPLDVLHLHRAEFGEALLCSDVDALLNLRAI